jgi:hypothetical protein
MIEGVMQEQVGQQRADDTPCGVPLSRAINVPSGISTSALSQRSTQRIAQRQSVCWRTAFIRRS